MTDNAIVDQARLVAGARYVAALEGLGFAVDAAMWTIAASPVTSDSDLQLLIVSRFVERAGTGAIYDLLFKAYDLAATPKDFDPWIVSLYGPRTLFATEMKNQPEVTGVSFDRYLDGTVSHSPRGVAWHVVRGRMFRQDWIYKRQFRSSTIQSDSAAYRRFKSNVEAFAA